MLLSVPHPVHPQRAKLETHCHTPDFQFEPGRGLWTPVLTLSLLTPQITSALSHPEVTLHEQVSGHQSAHTYQRGSRRLAGRPLQPWASVEHTPLYIRSQSWLLQPLSWLCRRDCSCSCGLRKSSNSGLIVQILNMEESTVQTSIEKKNFQSILKTVT